MNRLFVFGRFTHDSQGVLAAVYRLALVGIKLRLNIGILELSVAAFADAKTLFHDPQFALPHDFSPAHLGARQ